MLVGAGERPHTGKGDPSPGPFPAVPTPGTSPGSMTGFWGVGAATSVLHMAGKGTSGTAQKATEGNPNAMLQGSAHCLQGAEVWTAKGSLLPRVTHQRSIS